MKILLDGPKKYKKDKTASQVEAVFFLLKKLF
jgi:hypothetical protein